MTPQFEDDARGAVAEFEEEIRKKVVFFVDEFSARRDEKLKQQSLAVFRRNLMNTNACVVVASTDSIAAKMAAPGMRTSDASSLKTPWVHLCTELPRYVADPTLLAAVRNLQEKEGEEGTKELLELCSRSCPRFAIAVTPRIREFISSQQRDVREFVEKLKYGVVNIMHDKPWTLKQDGCYGYVVAMLTAGYYLETQNKDLQQLLGNFNNTSWAYLVNEPALQRAEKQQAKEDNTDEFALEGTDTEPVEDEEDAICSDGYEPIPRGDSQPEVKKREAKTRVATVARGDGERIEFITLFRRDGVDGGLDEFYFELEDKSEQVFRWSTYFPKPSDDILLYLGMHGNPRSQGLMVYTPDKGRVRISTAKLVRRVLSAGVHTTALTPSWEDEEALVSAAFMTASNSGPVIEGCSLEEFLTRFVAELLDAEDEYYVKLGQVDDIKWSGSFRGQFMWPYNTHGVPEAVNRLLNAVESVRPSNKLRFDAGTVVSPAARRDCLALKAMVEVKTAIDADDLKQKIHDALSIQDSMAEVSFIVVNQTLENLKNFKLEEYHVLNRATLKPGGSLRSTRLFKVEIQGVHNQQSKVALVPLDGKTSTRARRLIFLISTDDLKTQLTH
jgi:hypothetical protein